MSTVTPAARRVLHLLEEQAGCWVNSHDIRDAVAPGADVGIVRVYVHRLRSAGALIDSRIGCVGGYRLQVAA
jgi:predicted transcriptional regulator